MLNFEEELKKFRPALEADDAQELIDAADADDMIDLIREVTGRRAAPRKGHVPNSAQADTEGAGETKGN